MGQSKAIAALLAVLLGAAVAVGAYLMLRGPQPAPIVAIPAPLPAPETSNSPRPAAPELARSGETHSSEMQDIRGRKRAPDGSDGPAVQKVYGTYDPPAELLAPPTPGEPPPAAAEFKAAQTPDPSEPTLPVPTNAAGEPDPATDMGQFDPSAATPKAGS